MTKVLIVDDSATVRQQVGGALRQAGFEVVEADNGQKGADTIESRSDISLVVCDVNMPIMNGMQMLERVKGGGKHAELPILMLTTESRPELIQKAKSLGAKGWIIKPFKADLLVKAVTQLTS
ncbi:MAG: response regulator [Myxococcota bacterium]